MVFLYNVAELGLYSRLEVVCKPSVSDLGIYSSPEFLLELGTCIEYELTSRGYMWIILKY